MELTNRSQSTAWCYLRELCDIGVLEPVGETNN